MNNLYRPPCTNNLHSPSGLNLTKLREQQDANRPSYSIPDNTPKRRTIPSNNEEPNRKPANVPNGRPLHDPNKKKSGLFDDDDNKNSCSSNWGLF